MSGCVRYPRFGEFVEQGLGTWNQGLVHPQLLLGCFVMLILKTCSSCWYWNRVTYILESMAIPNQLLPGVPCTSLGTVLVGEAQMGDRGDSHRARLLWPNNQCCFNRIASKQFTGRAI